MSLQDSESSLASVIGSPDLGEWHLKNYTTWCPNLLSGDHPLAQLHTKFWGKSMAEEEQQWLATEAIPAAIPATRSELGDDRMDDGDERMDEGDLEDGEERTNVTDLEDDFTAGCYFLDIGIETIRNEKLWVRAEYIRMYDYVETRYKHPGSPKDRPPSVVITGQPGIGKTIWLLYALRRRLAERKPVIWYREQTCYLFVEEGVYQAPPNYHPTLFKPFVWTLVDSDEANDGIPSLLVTHGTRHFVIYTTSPRKKRWSRLHKTTRAVTVVMRPWTEGEIYRVAPAESRRRSLTVFDQFGPTPRLCIEFLSDPNLYYGYQEDVAQAISDITLDQLERLLKDVSSLTMDAVSRKICLVSRTEREDAHSKVIISPITSYIQSRLANQLRNLERREQLRLYAHFARVPGSRGTAGIFFEALAQRQFQGHIVLDLVPMVKLDPPRNSQEKPQWYSSHVFLTNPALEASREQALLRIHRIDVIPSRTEEFTENGPVDIRPNVYYLPEATNHVALDSFIVFGDYLFIFQFSIGSTHGIKPGLLLFFSRYPRLPPKSNWRFAFIIPHGLTLVCPQPRYHSLREVPLYSAAVKPSDWTFQE